MGAEVGDEGTVRGHGGAAPEALKELRDGLAVLVDERGKAGLGELADALDGGGGGARLAGLVSLLESGGVSAIEFAEAVGGILSADGTDSVPALGGHLTPWPLALWLADQVCQGQDGTVLDPACGVGHLLIASAQKRGTNHPADYFGWDLCPGSVGATRIGLWLAGGRSGRVADFENVRCLDALLDAPPIRASRILANPPFVSIRRLVRERGPDYARRLRRRFPRLRGNFDLYVPFLISFERWLEPTGRFGVILPATFWSAAYAEPARWALAHRLWAVHRFSDRSLFRDAAVTPHVLLGGQETEVGFEAFRSQLGRAGVESVSEGRAEASAMQRGGYPVSARRIEAETVPLGQVATIAAGTPGYHAHEIAAALREAEDWEGGPALPFVVTRCIEPYRLEAGPLRFLRRRFRRPVLPLDALTPAKRRLSEEPKILVAGVSRRLEAARDVSGVALGVGVYAVLPERLPVELVLALLNSACVSAWYRRRFLGRELSGGYFAVNCRHLEVVPVPRAWLDEAGADHELIELVRRREDPRRQASHGALERIIEARVAEALGIAHSERGEEG